MTSSHPSGEPVVRKNSVVLVIILTLVTLGLYVPIWFLRRQRWLDRLESPVKIGLWQPLLMLLLQVSLFVLAFMAAALATAHQELPAPLATFRTVASIVQFLLLFKLAFAIREILGDRLKAALSALSGHPSECSVELSWILTFLFSIWYLQFKINECATMSEQWTALAEAPPTT